MSALPPKADIDAISDYCSGVCLEVREERNSSLFDFRNGRVPTGDLDSPGGHSGDFCSVLYRNKIRRHETERRLPAVLQHKRSKTMRGRILRSLVDAAFVSFIAVLVLITVQGPIRAFTNDPPTPSEEQKQTDEEAMTDAVLAGI
jgi:hypothetical protein